MGYVEFHEGLPLHPKTRRAARLLGISRPAVAGHLTFLWVWCLSYAQEGDLSVFDAAEIADAAGWDGDPDAFVRALLDCGPGESSGFLERAADGRLLVHDWWDYGGKLVAKRRDNAERMRRARATHAQTTCEICCDIEERRGEETNVEKTNTPTPIARAREDEQAQREPEAASVEPVVQAIAETLLTAPWVGDELPDVVRAVTRSLSKVPEFNAARDGPLLAEKFARWPAYRKKPPADWYLAWLNWLKGARDEQSRPYATGAGANGHRRDPVPAGRYADPAAEQPRAGGIRRRIPRDGPDAA